MAQGRIEQLMRELGMLQHEVTRLRTVPQPVAEAELLQRVFADRIVLENLPEIVCILNRERRICYLTRTVPGYEVSKILGTDALDFVVPEHRERYCNTLALAWSSGLPQTIEHATTSAHSWRTRLVPVWLDGNLDLMLASSLDTTENLRETHERESRLRHAIDVVGMGTWTHAWLNDAMSGDEAACVIYGIAPSQTPCSHREFLARAHPDDHDRLQDWFAFGRTSGRYPELDHRIVRPNGEIRHVRVKGSTMLDLGRDGFGTLVAVFDITDRKLLEEQLHQRQRLEAMGELTAGIAHNFNNLLGIILPNVELCMRSAAPAMHARLADVEHAALRAADLIRRLMVCARYDGAAHKSPIDPLPALQRIVEFCRTTFGRSIQIELDIGSGDAPHLLANATQLEQTILNICINARDALLDANTPEPRIEIALERAATGALHVRVSDNGPGMDSQTRSRVFEPFFTTKEVGRGTGLGLATAYAIVEDHGGQIRCDSMPGEGTTFTIVLPAIDPVTAPVATESEHVGASQGDATVLIVDDEDLVRRATRAMLEHCGYRVLESVDGNAAIELVGTTTGIDLILLDRAMPGLSAEQTFARLQELAPEVPIVLLSGQFSPTPLTERAAASLTKPVRMDHLLSTIRDALDRRPSTA